MSWGTLRFSNFRASNLDCIGGVTTIVLVSTQAMHILCVSCEGVWSVFLWKTFVFSFISVCVVGCLYLVECMGTHMYNFMVVAIKSLNLMLLKWVIVTQFVFKSDWIFCIFLGGTIVAAIDLIKERGVDNSQIKVVGSQHIHLCSFASSRYCNWFVCCKSCSVVTAPLCSVKQF